jgi:hypothetical protein
MNLRRHVYLILFVVVVSLSFTFRLKAEEGYIDHLSSFLKKEDLGSKPDWFLAVEKKWSNLDVSISKSTPDISKLKTLMPGLGYTYELFPSAGEGVFYRADKINLDLG